MGYYRYGTRKKRQKRFVTEGGKDDSDSKYWMYSKDKESDVEGTWWERDRTGTWEQTREDF